MIHDIHPTCQDQAAADPILRKLMESEFEFYCTGSRQNGTQKPESDWDLFVEGHKKRSIKQTLEFDRFLRNVLGFDDMPEDDEEYQKERDFNNTVTVLELEQDGQRYQIQMVNDLQLAIDTREFVRKHFFAWDLMMARTGSKKTRRKLWQAICEALHWYKKGLPLLLPEKVDV